MSNNKENDRSLSPSGSPANSTGLITPIRDVDDIVLDEFRRSPQFVYVQEKVKNLPPPLKFKVDEFHWTKGYFNEKGIGMPLALGTRFIIALAMTVVPLILTYGKLVPSAYPLFSFTPPTAPNVVVEVLRGTFLLGVPYLLFSMIQIVICLIPWIVFRVYRSRNAEVHETLRKGIEALLCLRWHIGYAAAAVVMAVLARVLYPQAAISAAALEKATEKAEKKGLALDPNAVISMIQKYAQRPYQYYVVNGCIAFALSMLILLVEKLILRIVSSTYYAHGLSLRIQINKFGRKVTKALKDYFLEINPEFGQKNWDNGAIIINTIGKPLLAKEDFFPYMDEAEAVKYFSILDPDNIGTLNQGQFLAAIDGLYIEQSTIDRAYLDQTRIIGKFNGLLMAFVWTLSIIGTIVILDPSARIIIGVIFSFIGGAIFLFSKMAKQAFESIVFILFTHPFDADDWIIVNDTLYNVHELGLWVSSYVTQLGQLVYIPNQSLITKAIVNLRRSPIMSEILDINILPSTSKEKIKQLEGRILDWLKLNQRDFVPVVFIRDLKVVDKEHMNMELSISHRSNFNDHHKREFRTRKFILRLNELLKELNIELSPPLVAR